MRQKIRKAVAALSRGQLLRVDQTVAFDVNEPPYLPADALGACCTTGGAEDGTFCQCSDNVLGRDCCLQGGIHFPEAACADVTCCEPDQTAFGAFCNNAPEHLHNVSKVQDQTRRRVISYFKVVDQTAQQQLVQSQKPSTVAVKSVVMAMLIPNALEWRV